MKISMNVLYEHIIAIAMQVVPIVRVHFLVCVIYDLRAMGQ